MSEYGRDTILQLRRLMRRIEELSSREMEFRAEARAAEGAQDSHAVEIANSRVNQCILESGELRRQYNKLAGFTRSQNSNEVSDYLNERPYRPNVPKGGIVNSEHMQVDRPETWGPQRVARDLIAMEGLDGRGGTNDTASSEVWKYNRKIGAGQVAPHNKTEFARKDAGWVVRARI